MNCTQCGNELPQNAKFCSECGAKVKTENTCAECGEALKPEARFCHNCGAAVQGESQPEEVATGNTSKQSWLHSFGAFLFIPIFAGIIVLLFWVNKEPEELNASNSQGTAEQSMPSMAAMEEVHQTLERLKTRVEKNPEDLVAIDSLAVMYSIAGSYDKARQFYEKHLEIEPHNKDIKIALALTYHNLNRNDEAIALIQEILDEEPTYAFALYYLAEIHAASGNKRLAEENWQKIVDTYPGTEIANAAEQRIHELTHTE